MRKRVISIITAFVVVMPATGAHAQWSHDGQHGSWPDDLELQTFSGTVVVDSSGVHPVYYLDEDADGDGDVLLAVGPWWYPPVAGASLPQSGAEVTVVGHLLDTGHSAVLVVFEIDGVEWRHPMEYGAEGWNELAFWTPASDTTTVEGNVLVDTTYFYRHYYLDADNDSIPDYRLVFGPHWYEPPGVQRPEPGASITVFGSVYETPGVSRLIVYELDGNVWRDFDEPAPWAGRWVGRDHTDSAFAYCVNDSASWIAFPPGHTSGGMGHMQWPDSMFVQFWRIPPDSLPGAPQGTQRTGFFINVHDPTGESMMVRAFGGRGGMMSYALAHRIRLHYHDGDIPDDEQGGVRMMVWDEESNGWSELQDAIVDTDANTVAFSSTDLGRYYVLASGETSTRIEQSEDVPEPAVSLLSNYPNPFRGTTSIVYELARPRHVVLTVHDVAGREVATIVDATQPSGIHQEAFDGSKLPSGVYMFRLEAEGLMIARPMVVVD